MPSYGNHGVGHNAKAPLASGEIGGWLLLFTATFGYAAGWNPYASDYTRYLLPTTNRFMVGFWAGLGVFVSCDVLEMAGAVLATVAGTKWGPTDIPTQQLQRAMPDRVYYLTLLCIAVGAVAANVINIYSGTMSLVALGIREIRLTLRQRRGLIAVLAGIIGYSGGLIFQASLAPGREIRVLSAADQLLDRALAGRGVGRLLDARGRLRVREHLLRHPPPALARGPGHGRRAGRLRLAVLQQRYLSGRGTEGLPGCR